MAKTSIHIQPVKGGSEAHNKRTKKLDYVFQELTKNNNYWQKESQESRLEKIRVKYKNATGQKMQAKATPIREGVVVINEHTTMGDLVRLKHRIRRELGIYCFQIAIHRDEGYKNGKDKKLNLHAHMVFDWTEYKTGKSVKLNREDMVKMQTIVAEELHMERGISSDKQHLSAMQFKAEAERKRAQKEEEKLKQQKILLQETKIELADSKKLLSDSKYNKFDVDYQIFMKKGELEDVKKELKILKTQISELSNKNLSKARNKLEEINTTLEERKAEITQINRQIEDKNTTLEELRNKIKENIDDIENLRYKAQKELEGVNTTLEERKAEITQINRQIEEISRVKHKLALDYATLKESLININKNSEAVQRVYQKYQSTFGVAAAEAAADKAEELANYYRKKQSRINQLLDSAIEIVRDYPDSNKRGFTLEDYQVFNELFGRDNREEKAQMLIDLAEEKMSNSYWGKAIVHEHIQHFAIHGEPIAIDRARGIGY